MFNILGYLTGLDSSFMFTDIGQGKNQELLKSKNELNNTVAVDFIIDIQTNRLETQALEA